MTDVFYSVSPFGTGDIQTGAGNISITSGVATLTVAQTGNIGVGCAIEYNSLVAYISVVNSSTSFDVITATGGTPPNQTATAVTSVHHVWASLSAAEAAYMGASFLNTTDLVTNTFNPYFCCYYDHDDSTVDSTAATMSGATANGTYFLTIFTPQGGTESINDQRHDGKWNTSKYILATSSYTDLTIRDNGVQVIGLQISEENTGQRAVAADSATTDLLFDKCIIRANTSSDGILLQDGSITATIRNCLVYNPNVKGSGADGILAANVSTLVVQYCTVHNFADGIERDAGTVDITDCIVFDNDDDFDGTFNSVTYCASDDADGTNSVTLGTYASVFTDYSNGDFSLLNFTGSGAVIEQGTNISGITTDIIETARDGSTPDIGAFEYFAAGGTDYFETIEDTLGLTDSIIREIEFSRTITDTLGLTDTTTKSVGRFRTISDNLGLTDTIQSVRGIVKTITDTLGLTDSISRSVGYSRTIEDDLGLTDATTQARGIFRTIADTLGITDAVSRSRGIFRTISDALGLTDYVDGGGFESEGPGSFLLDDLPAFFDTEIDALLDLDTFLNMNEFGITAQYTAANEAPVTITVINDIEEITIDPYTSEKVAVPAKVYAQTADVPSIRHGDIITVDDITYEVLTAFDNHGITEIILNKT